MLTAKYQELAEMVVESLLDDGGSVVEFEKALRAEAKFQAARAHKEAYDYSAEELAGFDELVDGSASVDNLRRAAIRVARTELEAALVQATPSDDQIIIGHIRTASAILRPAAQEN